MGERPILNKNMCSSIFRSFYYLKEELEVFCRQEGLQPTGGKAELTDRIAHYLDTGERLVAKRAKRTITDTGVITKDSLIESDFICSEKHRAFLKSIIGNSFSFNVVFQKWLKANAGKTYAESVEEYYKILANKKSGETKIDKQFEYNTYIRDFFRDNEDKTLADAIECWKYKKSLNGHNKYERQDMIILK